MNVPWAPKVIVIFLTILVATTRGDPQWGTFRPHALISARAAVPHSPYFGFLYHPAEELEIRHLTTEDHDKIKSFSWTRHDGTFGDQVIRDESANILITTHFLAHPTEPSACALRVSGGPLDATKPVKPLSLIFYAVAAPEDIGPLASSTLDSSQWGTLRFEDAIPRDGGHIAEDVRILGDASSIGGAYTLRVHRPESGALSSPMPGFSEHYSGLSSRSWRRTSAERPQDDDLSDTFLISSSSLSPETVFAVEKHVQRVLRRRSNKGHSTLSSYTLDGPISESASVAFVQRVVEVPFQLDTTFVLTDGRHSTQVEHLQNDLAGSSLDTHLQLARDAFDKKFDDVFKLKEKGLTDEEQEFAKTSLANVMGGVGFFYGSSMTMKNPSTNHGRKGKPEFLSPVGLLTATPSRATFPRGFLWDEGFHQLIIQRWDPKLSQKCMLSWFEAIQDNGWIPREQILGFEARMRFPQHVQHLMIQNPLVANPPTILMPLRALLMVVKKQNESSSASNYRRCSNQRSDDGSCSSEEIDAIGARDKVLRSAVKYFSWLKESQAGNIRDSFRWRGRSRKVRSPDGYPLTLASGLDDYPRSEFPSDQERHVDLHCWITWASGTVAELTNRLGKDAAVYREEHKRLKQSLIDLHGAPAGKNGSKRADLLLCDYDGNEKLCHEGYITILPLALGLLDPTDVRLSVILDSLEDPQLLRARGGVRSLSKSDKWYRKGDDYWTGSIWVPFNFLTIAALKSKYSVEEGPYRERAKKLYESLKKSILDNTFRVFSETGQLWENYSPDEDATGKSGRQFTGWSALTLLIYADMFDGIV